MKLRSANSHRPIFPRRGFTLIECLIYISVFTVVLGAALIAFNHCFDNMKGLRRNADDISRALHAGEIWRNDVRSASGSVRFDKAANALLIPQPKQQVAYRFNDGRMFRKVGVDGRWLVLLDKVQNSQMESDAREHVKAWRWELELQTARKNARLRPLFTFLAVPTAASRP